MYTPEQSARLKQWGTAEVQDPVKFLQEMQYMKKFGLEALTYLIARGEPIPVVSDPDPCGDPQGIWPSRVLCVCAHGDGGASRCPFGR